MKRAKYIFIVASELLLTIPAQTRPLADTMTGIFDDRFKTLQTRVAGDDYAPPVITLNTSDRIVISFDEISEDRHYLRYSLVHCNADWQPSQLVDSEYTNGFNYGDVEDYEYSSATTVHYVNYRVELPNDQLSFTVSGNYLLQVYYEEDPDEILLQARFMVSESLVSISGQVSSRTDVDYNDAHQQLSLAVDTRRANVRDPFNDLTVVIGQNSRVDNQVAIAKPLRISGSTAYYEHLPGLIFPAGNEYRRMEAVSMTYPGMGVAGISYEYPFYHVALLTDGPRAGGKYQYDQTQFGRFTIREYNSSNSDTDADYMLVHFSLDLPEQNRYDIFLDGDFTCRRFGPESRMVFNRASGLYENTLLLKQGAYNYQYLAVPVNSGAGQTSPIEGDYYQTVNEYLVRIYYRHPGDRYDRLIGATEIYSGN